MREDCVLLRLRPFVVCPEGSPDAHGGALAIKSLGRPGGAISFRSSSSDLLSRPFEVVFLVECIAAVSILVASLS